MCDDWTRMKFKCPICRDELSLMGDLYVCNNPDCDYSVVM